MEAEDLMIGNWVYDKFTNKPIRLSEHEFCQRRCMLFVEPVELTEENIVDLLGFKEDDYEWRLFKKGKIEIDWDCKTITIDKNEYNLPKHVHKLQQLIKALEK